MNFTISTVLLVVAIILFVVAAINLDTLDTTSDVEVVAAGLAFGFASFLPWRR